MVFNVFVNTRRFIELAFALEVKGQVVEKIFQLVVYRDTPEFVKGHVQHTLALKRKPQSLVQFRTLILPFAERRPVPDNCIANNGKDNRRKHLQPIAMRHKKNRCHTEPGYQKNPQH